MLAQGGLKWCPEAVILLPWSTFTLRNAKRVKNIFKGRLQLLSGHFWLIPTSFLDVYVTEIAAEK